jgi:acyl-coenzyme A thioesterase PaaI-like protein
MVFDVVGPALLATLGPDEFQSTLELKTSFLRPTRPGRLAGRGRVVHRDGDLAFLDATLSDASGPVAIGTATARVTAKP